MDPLFQWQGANAGYEKYSIKDIHSSFKCYSFMKRCALMAPNSLALKTSP